MHLLYAKTSNKIYTGISLHQNTKFYVLVQIKEVRTTRVRWLSCCRATDLKSRSSVHVLPPLLNNKYFNSSTTICPFWCFANNNAIVRRPQMKTGLKWLMPKKLIINRELLTVWYTTIITRADDNTDRSMTFSRLSPSY